MHSYMLQLLHFRAMHEFNVTTQSIVVVKWWSGVTCIALGSAQQALPTTEHLKTTPGSAW